MVKVVAPPAAGDNFALALNIAKQHSGIGTGNKMLHVQFLNAS